MPYKVTAARKNQTVIVSLNQDGEERSVKLRGDMVAYSNTLTTDMKMQARLRYIICKFINNIPAEEVPPTEEPKPAVEETPVARSFTQDELLALNDAQVRDLFKKNNLDVDESQSLEDLQDALLAMQVAWVDPAELGD